MPPLESGGLWLSGFLCFGISGLAAGAIAGVGAVSKTSSIGRSSSPWMNSIDRFTICAALTSSCLQLDNPAN